MDGLRLDIIIDTLTANKAMFKLSRSFLVKFTRRNMRCNKKTLFVHIYPSDIHALALGSNDGVPSLHFSLDRSPALVIPQHGSLELKSGTENQLGLMRALALAKEFTVRLDNSKVTDLTRLHLQQVACIFAPNSTNRPVTDNASADLKSLYGGRGGIVANAPTVAAGPCADPSLPPPYKVSAPNARRRKRKRESSDTDDGRSSSPDMPSRLGILKEISDVEERLKNYLQSELDGIRKELDDMTKRSERLENSIADQLDTFRSEHGEDALRASVDEFVELKMDDHIVAIDEKFYDKEKEIDKDLEKLKYEMRQKLDYFDKRLKRLLKQELSNMRLHVSLEAT
ncbi:hypothetical protein GGI42DRAFT_318702 [Trichoderma sp. SZMC 28013]